jgi:hypothetical protein
MSNSAGIVIIFTSRRGSRTGGRLETASRAKEGGRVGGKQEGGHGEYNNCISCARQCRSSARLG